MLVGVHDIMYTRATLSLLTCELTRLHHGAGLLQEPLLNSKIV